MVHGEPPLSHKLGERRPSLRAPCDPLARAFRTVVGVHGGGQARGEGPQRERIDDAERTLRGGDLCAHVNPATPAHEEIRSLQPEAITLQRFARLRVKREPSGWIGCRERAVSATELAAAGAHSPRAHRQWRLKAESECPAMAAALKGLQWRTHWPATRCR